MTQTRIKKNPFDTTYIVQKHKKNNIFETTFLFDITFEIFKRFVLIKSI